MKTRILWLLIGVLLTVTVSQAWARTLSRNKANSEARAWARESRHFEGRVSNRVNATCKRGLAPGDPQYGNPNAPGYRTADGTSVHRFDCAVRPYCGSVSEGSGARVVGEGSSKYIRIPLGSPLTSTQPKFAVVTMRHRTNIFGQTSYPVSARRANCGSERCVNPQ
jgi:hypothetical protein